MRNAFILPLFAALLLLAGCTGQPAQSGNQTPPIINVTPNETTVVPSAKVFDHPIYGKILTNSKGLTLYVFTKDTVGVSNCNSATCLSRWVPLLADTVPDVPEAPGTFSLITRADANPQLAYNGMPLYLYAQDVAPGDAGGQGFGGVWFVAQINLTTFPASIPQNVTGNETQNVTQNQTQNVTQNQSQNNTPASAVKIFQSAPYGPVLTDRNGYTLYVFTQDSSFSSTCGAGCSDSWPPISSDKIPQVPGASGIFALITRPDGLQQIVYSGMPLYRYSGDTRPGTFNGDGIYNQWFVATANMTTFPHPPAPVSSGGGYY